MSGQSKNIYCLSGLGADHKVFERLSIEGCTLYHLTWIPPESGETLSSYAGRMLNQINEHNPILLGLSFGGMVAIEMAKIIEIKKLILISTVKTWREMPRWMRIAGKLSLHRILPIKMNRFTERADDRRMGIETIEEKKIVDAYRRNVNSKYIDWAVDQILNWKNNWIPSNAFHIHGENDHMFPIKNVRPTYVVRNGTHIMILNKADEISAFIREILLVD